MGRFARSAWAQLPSGTAASRVAPWADFSVDASKPRCEVFSKITPSWPDWRRKLRTSASGECSRRGHHVSASIARASIPVCAP